MMNNIQKYIDLLKSEKEKALKDVQSNMVSRKWYCAEKSQSSVDAFSFAIEQAELLLLNEPKASAETAPCANAVLGESAANEGSSTLTHPAGGLGETPAVRQNGQTQKVCPFCESPNIFWDSVAAYCCNCRECW